MKLRVILMLLLLLAACTHTVKDHPADVLGDTSPESACGQGQECEVSEPDAPVDADVTGKDAEVADAPEAVPDTEAVQDADTVTDADAAEETDAFPETDVAGPLSAAWVAWPVSTPGPMTGGDLVLTPIGPPGQTGGGFQGGDFRLGW
jgi:hypothetical protein